PARARRQRAARRGAREGHGRIIFGHASRAGRPRAHPRRRPPPLRRRRGLRRHARGRPPRRRRERRRRLPPLRGQGAPGRGRLARRARALPGGLPRRAANGSRRARRGGGGGRAPPALGRRQPRRRRAAALRAPRRSGGAQPRVLRRRARVVGRPRPRRRAARARPRSRPRPLARPEPGVLPPLARRPGAPRPARGRPGAGRGGLAEPERTGMSTTTAPTYESMVRRGREAGHEAVAVERGGDRAVVTLREPERLNALSAALVRQLREALEDLAADPAIRAVVLTGAGSATRARSRSTPAGATSTPARPRRSASSTRSTRTTSCSPPRTPGAIASPRCRRMRWP